MSRNYLILLIIAGFVGLLLGCHAGGNSPLAPNNGETVVSPETRTVGTNGRFTDITFLSGAVIKCPNDHTFQEGVKVTATEEKVPVITDNSGKFSYIYVYNISAVLPSENSLTADVPVNTIEKPLSVTIPNDSTAGTCYIGTRASDNDQWRYSLVTDGVSSNARFMSLSANTPKTCTFNLYRLNIQFRLFIFDNEENKDEVQVDTVTLAPADDVEIKDGKYTGKLTVKLNVEGDNLNDLKAEDLIAKITYRSENQQGANIDFTTNKVDSSDKAVTGSYEHSFEVSNIKVENTIGNTAELSFELNLDGVSLEDFPKDFLVEFYSKGSDENTRPFEYTQTFGFETKNQNNPDNPDPDNPTVTDYKITYDLKGGTLTEENPNGYNTASETFKLNEPTKVGYEFIGWTGSNGNTPQKPMSVVQGSKSDLNYVANYSIVNYSLTYTNVENCTFATANPTTYNVETETFTLNNPTKDDYIFLGWTYEGQTTPQLDVTITKGSTTGDKTYTANWEEAMIIASLKSATTNFAIDGQIQIEFDKEITWQDSYKSKITVTPTSTTTPITINTYSYSNKVLTLTPASSLKYNTGYTLAIAGIEKVSDKNLTFTTVDLAVTPVITSDSTNSPAELNGKFMLQPTFTIDFGKAVINQNSATSSVKLNGSALPDSAAFAFDSDGKIATLTFSSNLVVNTAYQLSITSFADDDNSTIKAVSGISFNTIETDPFGEGTESSPYLIFTATDLKNCGGSYYFKQMKDIILPNENWTPLYGTNVKYDGNHHKITGLKIINNEDTEYVGLFSILVGSEIKNLTLENVDISNGSSVGALAGQINYSDISNVKITGNININCGRRIGGLAGSIEIGCTIKSVHLSGNISIKGISAVGGLVGTIGQNGNVRITKSSVSSDDGIIEGNSYIGGLVGYYNPYFGNDPFIRNNISESYAKIKLRGQDSVGGLVGSLLSCEVENCYSDSTITNVGNYTYRLGGFFGGIDVDSKVTNSYSRGTFVIQADSANSIGGLIGQMESKGEYPTFTYAEVKNNFTSMSISGANSGNWDWDSTKVPLYYKDADGYFYEDATNKNYLNNGYPATGANWDGWDASVWSGLTTGGYPTLINNPPPAQP